MNSRNLQTTRTWTILSVGLVALAESLNPDFLRPTVASGSLVVHIAVALFGAACLKQAYLLSNSRAGTP